MYGVSSKPAVVRNATLQPVRSISAFVATVVPCVKLETAPPAIPASASAFTIACPGVPRVIHRGHFPDRPLSVLQAPDVGVRRPLEMLLHRRGRALLVPRDDRVDDAPVLLGHAPALLGGGP